jgi:hypothetical protein
MPTVSGFAIASSVNTAAGDAYTLNQFAELYVPLGVSVFATGPTFSGVVASSTASVENHGQIAGYLYGVKSASAAGTSIDVVNEAGATISNYVFSGAAISVAVRFSIFNYGAVTSPSGAPAILANGIGSIVNTGTITSNSGTAISQIDTTAGDTFSLVNSDTGVVVGGYNGGTSTIVESLNNRGLIRGNVTLGNAANDFMTNSGSGSITYGNGNTDRFQNYGGMGALVMGNGTGDVVLNFGTIGNITLGSGNGDYVGNAGRIDGNVVLGNGAGQVFDSTSGTLFNIFNANGAGNITAGSGGDTIVGAVNGGLIKGGTGNDVLIANQTQTAALTYHATTTLDGGGGANALYGGSGINNFLSGDAQYNQIWGGIAQVAGFVGYANNTVSYAGATAGVFVDLLNGHDAYIGLNAGKGWSGPGRFEDSIANVPNVIGSQYADLLRADNAADRITGGGGADQLFAGGGPDTFVYTAYGDSNTVTGYDTVAGFKLGSDKIDLTAFHSDATHLAISTSGTSNTVRLEHTVGVFNAATDLSVMVVTTTTGGLTAANFNL